MSSAANDAPNVYRIDLAHAYLEMARALYNSKIVREDEPTEEEVVEYFGYDPSGTLSMALASQSLFYSYLALEAWTNEMLYHLWQASQDAHAKVESMGKAKKGITPILDWFYQQYGETSFTDLRKTDLRELKERIKVVIQGMDLASIADNNPDLWRRLNQLLTPARQFLTHPIMDHDKLNEVAIPVLNEHPLQYWPDIAVEVIKYMHHGREGDLPAWVEKNNLLRLPIVELIGP